VLLRRAAEEDDVATTWITASELFYGAAKSRTPAETRTQVLHFLATLPVLDLEMTSVQVFGDAKAELVRRGRRLEDADLLIGAIAVARKAIVVTGNTRHFERIPGVQLENWMHG
jgi:tRNA(fMet)-specific endonuclease VapC